MEQHRLFFGILDFIVYLNVCFGFMTGAPDWSCKDPSTFHTLRLNATHEGIIMPQEMSTNPYTLEVDSTSFTPGSRVTVTIRGTRPEKNVNGFFIQAIQAGISVRDLRRQPFGTFENTTMNERPSRCQPINGIPRGGATHTNSAPKESVSVVWLAPQAYNPGPVQFLATGVNDYSTYWTDIRSPIINPDGYPTQEEAASFHWTPTASWYRWLQYVQQQQLLMDYISQTSNQQAANTDQNVEITHSTEEKKKAETTQNKKAERVYKTKVNDTSKAESTSTTTPEKNVTKSVNTTAPKPTTITSKPIVN